MKQYIVEAVGTLLLTLVVSFSSGNPLAIGGIIATLAYIGGSLSGAHYNPLLSIAAYCRGTINSVRLLRYILAQIVGGLAGTFFFMAVTGTPFYFEFSQEISPTITASIEFLMSTLFAYVFIMLMHDKEAQYARINGIILGICITSMAFVGGLFNPAIALGALATIIFSGVSLVQEGLFLATILFTHVCIPLFAGAWAAWLYRLAHDGK